MSKGTIAGLAFVALFVAASIGWAILQWAECRDMGHSVLYCIAHVS